LFIEIHTLWLSVTEVTVTTPPSRLPQSWNGEGEAIWKVPLLRAEGGEKEFQFCLVAPEDAFD
jgi:hypothetical protein